MIDFKNRAVSRTEFRSNFSCCDLCYYLAALIFLILSSNKNEWSGESIRMFFGLPALFTKRSPQRLILIACFAITYKIAYKHISHWDRCLGKSKYMNNRCSYGLSSMNASARVI